MTIIYRRTPWDSTQKVQPKKRARGYNVRAHPSFESDIVPSTDTPPSSPPETQEEAVPDRPSARKGYFFLHGLYIFDPERSTSADLQQFLWSGLRVLRTEAEARGLSEDEMRQLLVKAFDAFHDAADGIWATLRGIVLNAGRESGSQPGAAQCVPSVPAPEAPVTGKESPGQAELRRLSLLMEEQAAYNRACHDEELRDRLDD